MANLVRRWFWLTGLLLVVISSGGEARAGLIISLGVTETPASGGLTHYEYLLTNAPSSTQTVGALIVGLSPNASLSSISGPTGWDIFYTLGDTSVAWSSPDLSLDLPIGRSALFSFNSPLGPGPQDFLILGGNFDSATGLIDGPSVSPVSAVPEPSTLILAMIAVALCLPRLIRRAETHPQILLRRQKTSASSAESCAN